MQSTEAKAMKYTRKDYMQKRCSHREYYAQFVTAGTCSRVAAQIGVDRIRASQDEHFNDIPLGKWDNIYSVVPFEIASAMRKAGDYPTMAGSVCIAKEAARQIVELSLAER